MLNLQSICLQNIRTWKQTLKLADLNVVIYDSPLWSCAFLTLRSVPPTLFPLFRRRTATSRRRSTTRSGCATGLASCWPPAPRKTRPSKPRRTFRPAAPASWPTCQSCREWRRPRSCKKWRGGRQTRGRWTIDCHAKEGWPSQASKRLAINCVCVCCFHVSRDEDPPCPESV